MGRNQNDEVTNLTEPLQASDGQFPGFGDTFNSNGTNTVTISNVAPSEVGTATISGWLKVLVNNTPYFIPMWT